MHRNHLALEKVTFIVWEVGAFPCHAIGEWRIVMTICSEPKIGGHVVKYLDYGYGTHRTDCLKNQECFRRLEQVIASVIAEMLNILVSFSYG